MKRFVAAVTVVALVVGFAGAGWQLNVNRQIVLEKCRYSAVIDGEPFVFERSIRGVNQARIAGSTPHLYVGGGGRRLRVIADGDKPKFVTSLTSESGTD